MIGRRRRGREHALQMVFQWDLSKESFKKVRSSFWTLNDSNDSVDVQTKDFAEHLTAGTVQHINQIDILLERHAEHWRITRMSVVDRNIVRIATFELMFESETPKIVVINEALEIARKFSTSDSVQFINGILDSILKELNSLGSKNFE